MNEADKTPASKHPTAHDEGQADPVPPHSFARKVALVYGIGLLFMLAIVIVWMAAEVLLLVFAGALLAVLLNAATRFILRYLPIPRGAALGIVLVLLATLLGLSGYFLAPQISDQFNQLVDTIPRAINSLEQYLSKHGWGRALLEQIPPQGEVSKNATQILTQAGQFFSGAFGAFANFVIILFVGVYLAAQPRLYIQGVLRLIPIKKRARGEEVFAELGRTLELWLLGKLLSMIVIGISCAVGLWLLDIPLAIALGLLSGLLDFIPYLGPIFAGIPAILIAFSESPNAAFYVLLLFIVLQSAEGYLLSPLVERKTVSLPPAVTISTQVLFGLLFGMLGVALASPLAAAIFVLVTMLYVQDTLGDEIKTPSEQ